MEPNANQEVEIYLRVQTALSRLEVGRKRLSRKAEYSSLKKRMKRRTQAKKARRNVANES